LHVEDPTTAEPLSEDESAAISTSVLSTFAVRSTVLLEVSTTSLVGVVNHARAVRRSEAGGAIFATVAETMGPLALACGIVGLVEGISVASHGAHLGSGCVSLLRRRWLLLIIA